MTTPSDRGPGECLPCPFCGKAPRIVPPSCKQSDPYRPGDHAFPLVRCCHVDVHGDDWDVSCSSAVASWNLRAGGWLPIPEGLRGEFILYFPETFGRNAQKEMVRVDYYPVHYPRQPSHYMPLPAPPRPTQEIEHEG